MMHRILGRHLLIGASIAGLAAGVLASQAAAAQSSTAAAQAQNTDAPSAPAVPQGGAVQIAPADAPPPPPETGADVSTKDIVVTGSRIQSGFTAPTPITVTSAQELRAAAPTNVADGLNQLPVFNASQKTSQGTNTNSGGTTGQNLLNLRGLGANRTLILLDGRRLPATNASASVDINIIPQDLLQRVDVVTGGASAAYGSDAVAGVVNFVLDSKFKGLKVEGQTGISDYGDMPLYSASLSFGHAFADDRARLVGSAQYFFQGGVPVDQRTGRGWFDNNAARVNNPVAGGLTYIIIPNARSSIGTFGGLITSGPLKGTQFLTGGATSAFNYGTLTGSAFQSGGDGPQSQIALSPTQRRYNGFLHGEFDVTDHLTLFAEGLYARTETEDYSNYSQNTGSALQYTIYRDNAYLPAAVAARMDAARVTSFTLGRFEGELPLNVLDSKITSYHALGGVKGDFGGSWKWDVSYNYGRSDQRLAQDNLTINRSLYASADAVVNPATGAIVCRSTLAGLDTGCVPRNLFGPGQPSQTLNNYLLGNSVANLRLQENIAAANISGNLGDRFALAAPISVAAGVEYRKETARQTVDAISSGISNGTGLRGFPTTLQNKVGGWRTYNPQPLNGSYDIKEVYAEVGVPVLKDKPFAESINLDAAVRHSVYSQSGPVTTWKFGALWDIVHAFRLRGTYSQDIRAPNLLELYNPGSQTLNNLNYQGKSTQSLNIAAGNPNLTPEIAKTLTAGGVFRPGFLPGFNLSLDYYRIRINDAIGTLTEQKVLDQCAAGNTSLCGLVTVTSAGTLIIRNRVLNLSSVRVAGLDLEVGYRFPLAGGDMRLRLVGNHGLENTTQAAGSAALQQLGSTTTPKWSGVLQANYVRGPVSLFAQERYISKAKLDPSLIDGVNISYADNTTPAVFYTDLTATFDIATGRSKEQLFLTVNNLFNRTPPLSPPQVTTYAIAASSAYDQIGRYFTIGFRMKL